MGLIFTALGGRPVVPLSQEGNMSKALQEWNESPMTVSELLVLLAFFMLLLKLVT